MHSDYDQQIKPAVDRYINYVDWRLIKAQLWQESRLDPDAISPAGAKGIAQFMPNTWDEIIKKMGLPSNCTPFASYYAIQACCFYMDWIYNQWTAPRPVSDRYALTLASYNAGLGNILKAQKLADGANEYHKIIAKLPEVTGADNAAETTQYVERIFKYYNKLLLTGDL